MPPVCIESLFAEEEISDAESSGFSKEERWFGIMGSRNSLVSQRNPTSGASAHQIFIGASLIAHSFVKLSKLARISSLKFSS
jgi:hypothetical protein